MVRVSNLEQSLDFYCNKLGLKQVRRIDHEAGRFTLVFVAAEGQEDCAIELTYNWDPEGYTGGRNFGHVAYEVDDIYAVCARLRDAGVTINRPPCDGKMAFIRSPDSISIELFVRSASSMVTEPVKALKRPRAFDTPRCFTLKSMAEWTVSTVYLSAARAAVKKQSERRDARAIIAPCR